MRDNGIACARGTIHREKREASDCGPRINSIKIETPCARGGISNTCETDLGATMTRAGRCPGRQFARRAARPHHQRCARARVVTRAAAPAHARAQRGAHRSLAEFSRLVMLSGGVGRSHGAVQRATQAFSVLLRLTTLSTFSYCKRPKDTPRGQALSLKARTKRLHLHT